MQKELKSSINLTIAKLELKQLEFIDKLSRKKNDFVIRSVTCPETNEFIAVNGDWERVIGINEFDCIGKSIFDFMPDYEVDRARKEARLLLETTEFDSFVCDLLDNDGNAVSVDWKAKYFPQINATVSIGRVSKNNI